MLLPSQTAIGSMDT